MIQRIVQVVLLITLIGQSLLSPALATHDLMHSLSPVVEEAQPISFGTSSDAVGSSTPSNISVFNCADACTMLASGHCVSHCVSMTGIFIEPSLTKYRPTRSPQNSAALWSAQTTDPLPINRPPIA
ncbi:hypothetical protein [uncultured Shewanella sp.]|uniref:hypothetical protein n=1 Tax=Shewanella atlantica TaxID=271099 RepID=UPI0026353399|nr:hypothetical protein [uncultured Shewanella sp.]